MSPQQIDQASEIAQSIERSERTSGRIRAAVGLGFIAAGASATAILVGGQLDDNRFEREMSFNKSAQEAVNNVDDILGYAGAAALPASLLAIGVVKIGASRNNRLRSIDKRSSQELSDDGHPRPNIVRRSLRTVGAGSLPIVIGASAAVGALTTAIGTEITEGPNRPITSLDGYAIGDTMITQYEGAMPMLESKLSNTLTEAVEAAATERGIETTSISIGLNSIENGNQALTGLTLGIETDKLPDALNVDDCSDIPVLIDEAAHIQNGTHLKINGVETYVVGQTSETSATNRIGIVMDQDALETCINKNEEVQSHVVVLDTDTTTAEEILNEANIEQETATVISKDKYVENSKEFWESNVKPITNTLALVSLMTAFIAMGGTAVSRMLRNRRELAAKRAAGESVNQFRVTELVRSAKDGVLGSSIGVTAAAALTVPVNALESGMRVGLGIHEVMVGYAVGIVGTLGGTLVHIIRPNKVVDASEHTRV